MALTGTWDLAVSLGISAALIGFSGAWLAAWLPLFDRTELLVWLTLVEVAVV